MIIEKNEKNKMVVIVLEPLKKTGYVSGVYEGVTIEMHCGRFFIFFVLFWRYSKT